MQKMIIRLLSALTKEIKIGLIGGLAAGAILFCPNALASKAQPTESLKLKAEGGDPQAQFQLGVFYYHGQGVEQNYKTALKWLKRAGEQEHTVSQYWLGVFYELGLDGKQNYKTALYWYKLAGEQGHADSQYMAGVFYELGWGVEQNYKTALKWYKLAGEQGHVIAQNRLAILNIKD